MPAHDKLAQTGESYPIIADEHAVCDDCGAPMVAWIETRTGSLLCLTCCDFWEDLEDEAMVQA